jgi:hypothetical protein
LAKQQHYSGGEMKNLILTVALAAMFGAQNAYAQTSDNVSGTVASDNNTNSRTFRSVDTCAGSGDEWQGGTTCWPEPCFTVSYRGKNPSFNQICCHYTYVPKLCLGADLTEAQKEKIERSQAQYGIEQTFDPNQSISYWGYYGSTSRSPNNGRTTSIMARLDVCMGGGDATNAVATMNANTCYNSYCGSGSINEYCNATGNNGGVTEAAAVCHDRCECAINGTTHSTCNQL